MINQMLTKLLNYVTCSDIRTELTKSAELILANNLYTDIPREDVPKKFSRMYMCDAGIRLLQFASCWMTIDDIADERYTLAALCSSVFIVASGLSIKTRIDRKMLFEQAGLDVMLKKFPEDLEVK